MSLLLRARDDLGIDVAACHVNHGIRGAEADRDEAFCRAFCQERGVPFSARHADVPAYCEKAGVGLEEGARAERYRILREAAKDFACRFIATAHTADDQAETVLFRLARGTGFGGASGIPAVADDLIRPLLPFFTGDILSYLAQFDLPFVKDSSNEDTAFARNKIRRDVLPALEQAVPGSCAALIRFAETASWQSAMIRRCVSAWEERHHIDLSRGEAPFAALAPLAEEEADYPLLYEILRKMAHSEDIAISQERFLAAAALLKNGGSGRIIEIANGFSFFRRKDRFCFGKTPQALSAPSYARTLREGNNPLPEIGAVLTLSPPKPGKARNIHKNLLIIHAASDRIEGSLVARELRPGDSIRMNGMTKSVRKALCEAGFSADQRRMVPVICDGREVVWVPGLGLCDKARSPESSSVCTMELKYKNSMK